MREFSPVGTSIYGILHRARTSWEISRLALATILLVSCATSRADEDADIVTGCHFSVGEFGNEAINMCIRDQQAARADVGRYPDSVRNIVARCSQRWEPDWILAKRCIDRDVAAAAALESYAKDHGPILDWCREKFGELGDARVQRCVEQAIEAAKSPSGR
jgi:hypothetical protein